MLRISPSWSASGTPFKHSWEGLVNIDQFRWLVRKDCLEHLKMAHDELGARHVRAVGMYCDELRVFGPDPSWFGKPGPHTMQPNWQVVDYIIDELNAIGIQPMFTTTFMPSHMAAGDMTVFTTKSRTSMPKDLKVWEDFVSTSVRHQIDRLGLENVRNWYFEVWNEPNLSPPFFEGTQADFFKLWQATWNGIKRVDESLRVGGPSAARAEWIADFVDWAAANRCPADYVITHVYNNDSANCALSPFDGPQTDKANTSLHFSSGVVRGTRKILDDRNFRGEVHWNEWGRSWFPCDHLRESAQEAAWTAKTMGEVSQLADKFAYWNLSDVYDQVGYGATPFHDNYGMLNLQGLRKPMYQGFRLLSRLGDRQVPVTGAGLDANLNAIATTNGRGYQVYVYAVSETPEQHRSVAVSVQLPRGGTPTLTRIGHEENNILASWRAMGAPANLTRQQRDDLRSANALTSSNAIVMERRGDEWWATFTMDCPGTALMELAF